MGSHLQYGSREGGERTQGGQSMPGRKPGRRGLIVERIELQAVPPPNTMSPGSRRHIGSHPGAARASAAPPDGWSPT